VTDFLDEKRQEIASRLKELKPLVDEYNRLEAAASALASVDGSSSSASSSTKRRRGPGRPRKTAKRATAKRATAKATATRTTRRATAAKPRRAGRRKGSGTRAAEANALVRGQPGITIPELAAKMGIKQNYLYRVLPALEQEGKVVKRGRGWHPKG
jgi:hypothetical protein